MPSEPVVSWPPGYRLRLATNADAESLRQLIFGVLAEYGLRGDPEGTDRDLANLDLNYFQAGGWFAVVLDASDALVGSVGLMPQGDDSVELRKMYLGRRHRGQGLGRALLASAIAEARSRGFRRLTLETASVLAEALRLYERNGFRRAADAPHACRCDVVMERAL